MKGRIWTDAEVDALFALMGQGLTLVAAAGRLGRGKEAIRKKWAAINDEPLDALEIERPVIVPKERLIERRRRLAAPHRTLVGACVGDPPVGYSALDRRGDASTKARAVTVYTRVADAPPLQPSLPDEPAGEEEPRDHEGGAA